MEENGNRKERSSPLPPEIERVGAQVVDAALAVHRALGPGLLESVYEVCLARELAKRGLHFQRQVEVPVVYDDILLQAALRLDLLVEKLVVIELKAVEALSPLHHAQLLTYLRLSGYTLGYLINFNVPLLKDGLHRKVMRKK
ncbi:MAG TPA: GxxExxY protein [Planctomycetota bacterium]|nr:GxxExxY protein [Planctomycetota bacterium]